ncbi:MAG: cyclic nucleotide-binding domain-containing protein [Betaproteobacteria bacterium]|jgi:CRP/FNR family cyclic AMP-dependent transcriptional regulator|nr:cyclic nucleotide-binding domain-containing protein [Betaproteobacteria bacterium]MBK7656255.1 cyclic nucleotide-binding domain-containing protein [Betaproteobacteria bacterium]MBP6645662.1 cyclic nucleotide-binding domain-containing protein [Burkholderiaceae bacterium]
MNSEAHSGLSDGQLIEELASLGQKRRWRRGSILIQEGDMGDTLFIILSGRLRVYSSDPSGKEVTLGLYGEGEYVGEMSLDGGARAATVATVETTECAVISRDTLVSFISQRPEFAMTLITRLIRRARLATESARTMALLDVYGRLTRLLTQLAMPQADGTWLVAERMTHLELSRHLACSREMVSRLLKDLQHGGFISVQGHSLVLLKALPQRW